MSKATGDEGERYVVKNVPCPSCSEELQPLPPSFPLFDVQCSSCVFRAQVKTSKSKPKATIFGAGWAILEHALKIGQPVPPLIVNFVWQADGKQQREIRFYPFVPRSHLRVKLLKARNYKMFNYERLGQIPSFTLRGSRWTAT